VKREKKLTKREQKALKAAQSPGAHQHEHAEHIHCVACGRHIDPSEITGAPGALAVHVRCAHGGLWHACAGCVAPARELLAIHDRTGRPVQQAERWH
jgi:hypothetical protein